jgi:cell division protein FtsW
MIQTFVNIGAMVGLLPLTGVPLPFISYGGTSMFVLLAACGIVINISRQTRE